MIGGIYVKHLYATKHTLYVTGAFTEIGGIKANKIARWDGAKWSAFPTLDSAGGGWVISAAHRIQGELYVGGNFEGTCGPHMADIARWDGAKWKSVGNGPSGLVTGCGKIMEYEGKLLFSGNVNRAFGDPGDGIIIWDGQNWPQFGEGLNGGVWDMRVHKGELYAGGSFRINRTGEDSRLARWDGNQWHAVGFFSLYNFSPPYLSGGAEVSGLASVGEDLFICGGFKYANGQEVNSVCRYNTTTGLSPLGQTSPPVQVWPTPATDQLCMSLPAISPFMEAGQATLALRDMAGREVLPARQGRSTGLHVLPLAGIPAGTYVLTVTVGKVNYTQKVVVNECVCTKEQA